ncbi:MAG: tetratricopeptide repeat protein [Desulfobacteraceae bacterium]|nr:MAG: tetratricopeptide repeat protein [Desulfobacteraceae bacterium]
MQESIKKRRNSILRAVCNVSNSTEQKAFFPNHVYLGLIFMILLVVAIYSNTFHVPFLFDDEDNILLNTRIRLTQLSWNNLFDAAFKGHLSNRPVAKISFALNYYLGGYHVFGYHFINLLIHIISGIFLYHFIVITGKILPNPLMVSRIIPFFATAIWLVHPIQTQSVTYIVQRMNSMASLFYIISLFLYAKARLCMVENQNHGIRENRFGGSAISDYPLPVYLCFTGSLISGIMALGTKEIAATLPFFMLLYEWFFLQDLKISWLKRYGLLFAGVFLIIVLVAMIYLGGNPLTKIVSMYERRDFTLMQRLLTEFRVVVLYISLLLFPHPSRLNLEHDVPLSTSLIDPISTILSLSFIILCFIFSLLIAKKERLLSFCILWFFGNLVIESSLIGLEIIFEHRLYLPSMMMCLLIVSICYRYLRYKWLSVTFLIIVVSVFSVWTYHRNQVWKDEITLLMDCVLKSPNKFRPHYNLGIAMAEQGRTHEAVSYYLEALRIDPEYASLHTNLGLEFFIQGKRRLAIEHYKEALRIQPDFVYAHVNLGSAMLADGKTDQAMKHCEQALQIQPNSAQALNCMGSVFYYQGRTMEAIASYSKAIQNDKQYAEAANNLGVALIRAGQIDQAVLVLQAALKIKPDYKDAKENLDQIVKHHF